MQSLQNCRGVTTFDEVRLKNDIDAACANASAAPERDSKRERDTESPKARLKHLETLLTSELITEAEYHDKRRRILDEF